MKYGCKFLTDGRYTFFSVTHEHIHIQTSHTHTHAHSVVTSSWAGVTTGEVYPLAPRPYPLSEQRYKILKKFTFYIIEMFIFS